jgi:DNA topoisomerase-1
VAVKNVACQPGNRSATCRKYYIHPAMFDAYADGSLFAAAARGAEQAAAYNGKGLRPEEYCVLVIVAQHLESLADEAAETLKARHARKAA